MIEDFMSFINDHPKAKPFLFIATTGFLGLSIYNVSYGLGKFAYYILN